MARLLAFAIAVAAFVIIVALFVYSWREQDLRNPQLLRRVIVIGAIITAAVLWAFSYGFIGIVEKILAYGAIIMIIIAFIELVRGYFVLRRDARD